MAQLLLGLNLTLALTILLIDNCISSYIDVTGIPISFSEMRLHIGQCVSWSGERCALSESVSVPVYWYYLSVSEPVCGDYGCVECINSISIAVNPERWPGLATLSTQ